MREREQLAPQIEDAIREIAAEQYLADVQEQQVISAYIEAGRRQAERAERIRQARREAWQSIGGPQVCGGRVERWSLPGEERAPGWLAAVLLLACAGLGWLMLVGAYTCLRWMGAL